VNRTTSRRLPWAAALGSAALLAATPARGVIIDTQTGTGNTSAPTDDPGWANVGTVNNGSAVYLGNRWAITATHVWTGPTTFGGTTYQNVSGSEITLSNDGAGPTPYADLVLYQLATDPGLPALTIASSTSARGTAVTMIGSGKDRGAFTTWTITGTSPPVWTESSSPVNAAGYLWDSSRTMRWGTNTVAAAVWIDYFIDNPKSAYAFETIFDVSNNYSAEAQAATGDSGGGVFRKNGGSWELTGIMLVVDAYSGQPTNTAVFGNSTYSADLSFYRSQIMAVVPEPSAVALAAIGTAALVIRAVRSGARRPRRVRAALAAPAFHERSPTPAS